MIGHWDPEGTSPVPFLRQNSIWQFRWEGQAGRGEGDYPSGSGNLTQWGDVVRWESKEEKCGCPMERGVEGWVEALATAQVTEEESLAHMGLSGVLDEWMNVSQDSWKEEKAAASGM